MLMERIEQKQAVVGVIGMGYVGLPLMLTFFEHGFPVRGFDVDAEKPRKLKAGENYILHIGVERTKKMVASDRFDATTDFSRLAECDAVLICVPTPLNQHREPDLSYVENSARVIAKYLRPGQLIILESTTYPGTTEDLVLPILEETGLRAGLDFYLAFSPEREDPGNKTFNTGNITKVVGGHGEYSGLLAEKLYGSAIEKVLRVSSTKVAEMTKILENTFRAVNIALVNELKMVGMEMGIDIWEVIEASKTKPFGYMPFYPGPGLGGHCIPIDPFYLTWKAREFGQSTRFIELAGEINTGMPHYVVQRLLWAFNDRQKSLKGSKVLILGASYKPDIDDIRESPTLELIKLLQNTGAAVEYQDPYIPYIHEMRHYNLAGMASVGPLTPELLASYDAVLISTNHAVYDYDAIVEHAALVVDTRNATRNVTRHREKIVKA